jgi:hypothetical protein
VVLHEATEVTLPSGSKRPIVPLSTRNRLADLLRDGPKEIFRRCPLCHHRRDAPQRRLLLGQLGKRLAWLGVSDRGRHQLREGGDPGLGILGPRLDAASSGHQRAPELPFDEDRRPDGRAQAQTPCNIRWLTLRLGVAVYSRGSAGLEDAGDDAVAMQCKPCPDWRNGAAVAAPPSDRRRGVALEDVQSRKVGTENQPDRLSDGREDLAGGRLLRHEYRHSAQRRLLVSESLHLCARLGVGDRSCHELGELVETRLGIRC